ncbi:hypothetical protein [Sphaerothrix gracilis]|uniref:hypothetical protein n=1 Tax=Sphaerothrix gracilis TaxID=3151835 RepID=UPI0031FC88FB
MARSPRRAGQNVRKMALHRRSKAVSLWLVALGLAIAPVILQRAIAEFSRAEKRTAPALPPTFVYTYGLFWTGSAVSVWRGRKFWQRANRADQGARAEEEIAQLLQPLTEAGWRFDYNMPLGGGWETLILSAFHRKSGSMSLMSNLTRGRFTLTVSCSIARWGGRPTALKKIF